MYSHLRFSSVLLAGEMFFGFIGWLLLGLSAELGTCFWKKKKQRLFIVWKGDVSIEACVRLIFIKFISSNFGARTHTGIAHKTTTHTQCQT